MSNKNIYFISNKYFNPKTNDKKSSNVFSTFLVNYSKKAGLHGIHYLCESYLHWSERFGSIFIKNLKTFRLQVFVT